MGLKEPFNSISHMVGGGLALVGLVVLVILAQGSVQTLAAVLYGLGLVTLFTMSTLYHSIPGRPSVVKWLERMDHVAIYLLIAGTYTPVCLVLMGGAWGWSLFGVVWGIAIMGIVLKLTVPLGPEWVHITGYIGLGWIALVAAPVLFPILTTGGLTLLVAGGVIYTLGAFLYAWDRPKIIGNLGAHEIWHIMVIGGALAHFSFILIWVY